MCGRLAGSTDELGYAPFSKAGAELLFEDVSRACGRHSLIVTTKLPDVLEANGESHRLREVRNPPKGARLPAGCGRVF